MSEILLQTLVEKVTAVDKRSLETQEMIRQLPDYSGQINETNKRFDSLQIEVGSIPAQISIPGADIMELKEQLRQNTEQLKQPLQQAIRHIHHLNWPVITCMIMAGIIFSLIVLLTLAWDKTREHRDADIKYRRLKLIDDPPFQKLLHAIDSEQAVDPIGVEKRIIQAEQRQQEERETRARLERKRNEIRELEEKEKANGTSVPYIHSGR